MLSSALHQQRGAALIIGLILIMVGSIGAVAIMRGNHLHDRMASNHHNKVISQMAAEAGAGRFLQWVSANGGASDLAELWETDRGDIPEGEFTDPIQFPPYGYFYIPDDEAPAPDWSLDPIPVTIIGVARSGSEVLAETHLRLLVQVNPSGPIPPAAISCMGGPCNVTAGSSSLSRVDGRDHDLPPSNCSGNSCWESPVDPPTQSPLPSVFLDVVSGSNVVAGGNNSAFCGASYLNPSTTVCGRNGTAASVWNPSSYQPDSDGASTAPTRTGLLGEGSALYNPSGVATWGTRDEPQVTIASATSTPGTFPSGGNTAGLLIIDGIELPRRNGTGIFAGLVVIKNCGRLQMGGNFNVYGAIIIDASNCGVGYDPFSGNGTPSIRYSSAALRYASNSVGGGGGFTVTSWTEVFPSG